MLPKDGTCNCADESGTGISNRLVSNDPRAGPGVPTSISFCFFVGCYYLAQALVSVGSDSGALGDRRPEIILLAKAPQSHLLQPLQCVLLTLKRSSVTSHEPMASS